MSHSDAGQVEKTVITPDELIEQFGCAKVSRSAADRGEWEKEGVRIRQGHCGYIRDDAGRWVGFGDGYDFMDFLSERGWVGVHDIGEWPYIVYCVWRSGRERAIIEYCEGDLTLWEFPNEAKAIEFADTLS